jgi:hypothetical protein
MSHTDRLRRSPNAFRQLTGITPDAFDRLLAQLTPLHEAAEARRKDRPGRRRKPGAGPKHKLPLSDRLLMLLIYYRTYTTHAFLGFLFGVDDSAVGRNINPLQPLLAGIFRIPERRIKLDPEEMRDLFFDATERPTRRPEEGQRAYYSGTKKRHTIKNQVVVAPPDVMRTGDTASIGTSPETPARPPRGGELTAGRKRANRVVSRRRIVAEHGIGEMKIWRIASERYRNPDRRHTPTMKNVAGLHNLMYA